jgi:hypothetical protein
MRQDAPGTERLDPDPLYDKAAGRERPIRLYRPQDFIHDPRTNSCICPAGQRLYSNGSQCKTNGRSHHKFTGALANCVPCEHRQLCLRHPERTRVRQVSIFRAQPSQPPPADRADEAGDPIRRGGEAGELRLPVRGTSRSTGFAKTVQAVRIAPKKQAKQMRRPRTMKSLAGPSAPFAWIARGYCTASLDTYS